MDKLQRKIRRRKSIRKKIFGGPERPRMCVHKSNTKIYVQIVNDVEGKTLCSASSALASGSKGAKPATFKNVKFAATLGKEIARIASEKGIKQVVFDRGGCKYHGRIKALAEAAREAGLKF